MAGAGLADEGAHVDEAGGHDLAAQLTMSVPSGTPARCADAAPASR
jgi:hypothetical protein